MTIVGMIGATGLMGHGMAHNIVTKGFELRFTLRRDTEKVSDLVAAGARQVADNAELGRECDIVVICVTSSADVEQVVLGPGGLLTDPKSGLIIVDASTAEPGSTRRLAEAAAARGVGFVDAPLTGGPQDASDGTLNALLGGTPEALSAVRPVVETYAKYILETGGVGTAHTLKLINNTVIQAFFAAVSEGFGLAAKTGLDPRLVTEILSKGNMANGFLPLAASALDGEYDRMKFGLSNATKDVRYYTRLAGELGYVAPMGAATHEVLATAVAQGYGDEFVPSIVKSQAQLNGVRLGPDEIS